MIASKRNSLGQRKPSDKHGSVLGPRKHGLVSPTAYAGLVAWYDASDAGDLTVDGSNLVANWADRTGLGSRDLVQATGASKPVYVAAYLPDNLVTGDNSTFASDTGFWSKIGATISGGNANLTAGTALRRNALVTIGRVYRVTFSVSGFSFGGVNPVFDDGVAVIQTITGNGSYDFIYTAKTADVVFSANTSAFSVTNVTVGAVGGPASVYFDGTDDFLKTAAFTLNQPSTVYFVGSQATWTIGDYLFDGFAANSLALIQTTATPQLNINAGSSVGANTTLAVGTRALITAVFNGASSTLRVNQLTQTTGNAGAANAGGLTLGASATPGNYGNATLNEWAIYNTAHTAAQQAQFWQYAKRKWRIVG